MEPRWFRRWVGKHKAMAERELRRQCQDERQRTVWIDARWLDELGRDRVQEIVLEYGYGPLKSTRAATIFGAPGGACER